MNADPTPAVRRELLVLLALAALLYTPYLATAPPFLATDEVFFGVDAQLIASTAHDVDGRFMPLYFQVRPGEWFQPAIVYFTALFLKVLPFSEWTIRLPSVVLGLIDIALMYYVGTRLFRSARFAILAAALLLLTPAHFIHSRIAMDFVYPVPFTMAWLLCLVIFIETRRPWLIFAATSFLGIASTVIWRRSS